MITSTLININTPKGGQKVSPKDFMLRDQADVEDENDANFIANLEALARSNHD